MRPRDPRLDPQPGDIVQQNGGKGLLVRVTKREGDLVEWESKTPKGKEWKNQNRWNLHGWARNVCETAIVIETSHD